MPTDSNHKLQFTHNCKLLAYLLEKTDYTDWIVTVAFYFSVHCLEWYLYNKYRLHSGSHEDRDNKIRRCSELGNIYSDYRELYYLSKKVRYDCVLPTLGAREVSFALDTADKIQKYIGSLCPDFPHDIHIKPSVTSNASPVISESIQNKISD